MASPRLSSSSPTIGDPVSHLALQAFDLLGDPVSHLVSNQTFQLFWVIQYSFGWSSITPKVIEYHTLLLKLGDPVSHLTTNQILKLFWVIQYHTQGDRVSPVTAHNRWSSITPCSVSLRFVRWSSITPCFKSNFSTLLCDSVSHFPDRIRWSNITPCFQSNLSSLLGDPVSHPRWLSITRCCPN